MIERFVRWAGKKYTVGQRILALAAAGAVFLVGLPALLVWTSGLDRAVDLPRFVIQPFNAIVALILVLAGVSLGIWSNRDLFDIGEGTPIPMMPTRRLVIAGPYRYCRNPMALAAICGYLGVVAYIGSPSSMALLTVLAAALLIYIRCIEEKELEARFGQAYIDYKKQVPFIVPRFRMR